MLSIYHNAGIHGDGRLYNMQSNKLLRNLPLIDQETPIVAIIGAGPAGLYAAKQLMADGCQVVVFNRDIKPGGLAEYGIYPDKHRMKEGLRAQFRGILASTQARYFGNVCVGKDGDITLEEIREMGFHAILVAVGAQGDKYLGIPGETSPGVFHAKEIVYHYNKLPPYSHKKLNIGKRVAIVGVGNVMMDIARWLMDDVQVDEVIAVARRGPAEVKFDRKELETVISQIDLHRLQEEINRVSTIMRLVEQDPDEAIQIYHEAQVHALDHHTHTNLTIRFLSSPRQILLDPTGKIRGLEIEATTLIRNGEEVKAVGTGELSILEVDTVIFAIGDSVDTNVGLPMDGNQFVKNPNSRFLVEGESYESCASKHGDEPCGVFVAGWARKASTGVVGVARRDGTHAANAIKLFLTSVISHKNINLDILCESIKQRLPKAVTYEGISKLEIIEKNKAEELALDEYKFDTNEEMLRIIKTD